MSSKKDSLSGSLSSMQSRRQMGRKASVMTFMYLHFVYDVFHPFKCDLDA